MAFKVPFTSREDQMKTKQVLRQLHKSVMDEPALKEKIVQMRWAVAFQKTVTFVICRNLFF